MGVFGKESQKNVVIITHVILMTSTHNKVVIPDG